MAQLSESRMNVAALKRVDPYVKDIVETAAHVALYTFNGDDNEWEKTEVEGALFVYSRSGEPFHNIIIMNRLNTKNFVEPVTQGLDLHIQDPFLLYRTSRGAIFCIWFYDKEECSRIATALKKLVKETAQSSEKKNVKKLPKEGNNANINCVGNVDIFSMLTKAQEEYKNKSPRKNDNEDNKNPKEALTNTPRSVMEFFAKASSGTQFNKDGPKNNLTPNLLMGARPLAPPGLTQLHPVPIGLPHQQGDVKIIQRLMSNPAHSVEHIEKQQHSLTPQSELVALMKSKAPNLINANKELTKHPALKKNKNSIQTSVENKTVNPQQNQKSSASNIQSQIENGMGFLRIKETMSPNQNCTTVVQTQNFFNTNLRNKSPILNNDASIEQRPVSAPHGSTVDSTHPKPALMPPVMFTSSAVKEEPGQVTTMTTNQHPLGMLPTNNHVTMIPNVGNKVRPEPLTRNQLLQAFDYLLKNDPDFTRLLHEAYVKSFSEMVS